MTVAAADVETNIEVVSGGAGTQGDVEMEEEEVEVEEEEEVEDGEEDEAEEEEEEEELEEEEEEEEEEDEHRGQQMEEDGGQSDAGALEGDEEVEAVALNMAVVDKIVADPILQTRSGRRTTKQDYSRLNKGGGGRSEGGRGHHTEQQPPLGLARSPKGNGGVSSGVGDGDGAGGGVGGVAGSAGVGGATVNAILQQSRKRKQAARYND